MGPHLRTCRITKLSEQDYCSNWCWHYRFDEVQGGFTTFEEAGRQGAWCGWLLESSLCIHSADDCLLGVMDYGVNTVYACSGVKLKEGGKVCVRQKRPLSAF